MEQETFFSEKVSFANQNYKKYGTTTHNNLKRNQQSEVLIRHDLTKTDTLQGIAIQYGCSMEQIRRANRLFANDSLFLRAFLMIPVSKDSPFYPKDAEQRQFNNHMLAKRANTIGGPSSSKNYSPSDSMDSLTSPTDDDEHRKYMEEFLDKIDSSIASSKKMVREQQKNSDFITSSQSDDSLYSSGNSFINHNYDLAHPSGSSSYQQYQSLNHQSARHSLGGMSNDSNQIIVRTQGRHIKNSLQRLEKQQDEIFEL
ncbi:CLUMA_CG003009, isoform A [Clunio marinus]|uniref:CLUMA_CG003009, isoform A n=1 Tax=Clunio marinus TaxID=568069 RepID=A0A1J1HNZ0_9DIPT|nr:CLUMA_CG003009, isoform A [Clunio marinus]